MNYTDKTNSVRVDFFKKSGKWYTTEAVEMLSECYDNKRGPVYALAKSLDKHLDKYDNGSRRLDDMVCVCLQPYNEWGFPVMFNVSDIDKLIAV